MIDHITKVIGKVVVSQHEAVLNEKVVVGISDPRGCRDPCPDLIQGRLVQLVKKSGLKIKSKFLKDTLGRHND